MRRRSSAGGEPAKARGRKAAAPKRRSTSKSMLSRSARAAGQKGAAEARRLKRSLRESEERYALVSEAVAEGIYDWNIELNSLFVSSHLMEIFGFEGAGLTSEDWTGRVHPEDMEGYRTALRECFKQRSLRLECQYRIRAADGNYRWVEDHGLPIRNQMGRTIRLVGTVSDISRRRQMEQALFESEQRYALAMQAVNEGVYDWNISTSGIYYSPSVRNALGLTPEELGNRTDWLDRIHPDDLTAYKQAVGAHLKGETDRLTCEYRYRHPDGTWHWARQHGLALRDQTGRAYRMAGSTGDITAERSLLSELRQRTTDLTELLEQQAATSEVLNVISRSKFDLQPILQSVVDTAARLCRADTAVIFKLDQAIYRFAAGYCVDPQYMEIERATPITPGPGTVVGRAAMRREAVQIVDAMEDPLYEKKADAEIAQVRSMIGVPLMREGEPIGVIALARQRVEAFGDREIELVSTFADQAAIAIENVRLFESVEARTRELAKSLEDLRAAQDRLVQTEKLASLGQLTAGIAHEIKNPLNFVNNFSSLSVELIDELQEELASLNVGAEKRSEIAELAETLKGNLDKVVQHGKRADAIVKNMLLHSRQGSGEHRLVDVNALVEESLNLAYHGARAEKQGFEITLEKSFDPAAGEADLSPRRLRGRFST